MLVDHILLKLQHCRFLLLRKGMDLIRKTVPNIIVLIRHTVQQQPIRGSQVQEGLIPEHCMGDEGIVFALLKGLDQHADHLPDLMV